MRTNFRHNLLTCLALLALAVFPATAKAGLDLTAIGTYETGVFDGGASEIVAFDPETKRLFVINATDAVVDVLDVSDPSSPVKIFTIDVTHDIGPSSGVNSVDVKNGLVAVAAENADRTLPGYVVFYNTSGEYITHVGVGVLPDSVRFSPDGLTLVTADEGEPVEDDEGNLAANPPGSISVINISNGVQSAVVTTLGFEAFDGREAEFTNKGLRLEPVLGLISLGTDYGLNASDEDGGINILSRPVLGMFQPDTITPYEFEGKTYYVTANEGDTRDFDFFSEEERVEDLILDPFVFPDASDLLLEENLGRLKTTNIMGDIDGDGDNDRIFTFGARSLSIWDSYGNLVYDSGGDFERITAEFLPNDFNSDNAENDSFDSRSDDKGPEPEAMEIGRIGDRVFAFIGLERISGVMVYDVTDPFAPFFVSYVNNRDFSVDTTDPAAGDIGPECIKFVPAEESPNGAPILIVGNEISGTTTIYSIDEKD